jgi:hypothetical protein
VIPNYNHPARTAEGLATLDIISNGRVDFGIGEGATRLELGGFSIPAKEKRAMALEAAEQIANMMALEPYPGFEGKYFSMPCRNILPKPVQKSASADLDGLHQPRHHSRSPHRSAWARWRFRSATRRKRGTGRISTTASSVSEQMRTVGRSVMPTAPWCRRSRSTTTEQKRFRRGHEGFEFFSYADERAGGARHGAGRTDMWGDYLKKRGNRTGEIIANTGDGAAEFWHRHAETCAAHLTGFQAGGRRPGDLPAAGGPQPARAHLRIARTLRRRRDAGLQADVEAREAKKRPNSRPGRSGARAQEMDAAAGDRRGAGRAGLRAAGAVQSVVPTAKEAGKA